MAAGAQMKEQIDLFDIPEADEAFFEKAKLRLPPGDLIVIVAGHFVAGVELKNGIAVRAAPIIRYMKGWSREAVVMHCRRKKWEYHLR